MVIHHKKEWRFHCVCVSLTARSTAFDTPISAGAVLTSGCRGTGAPALTGMELGPLRGGAWVWLPPVTTEGLLRGAVGLVEVRVFFMEEEKK